MNQLKAEYAAYMARWKADGKHTLMMSRACGCGELEVTAPSAPKQTWDSLMVCPDCDSLMMSIRTNIYAKAFVPPEAA